MECTERERDRDDSLKAHLNTALISAHVLSMSATVLITYITTLRSSITVDVHNVFCVCVCLCVIGSLLSVAKPGSTENRHFWIKYSMSQHNRLERMRRAKRTREGTPCEISKCLGLHEKKNICVIKH